MGNIVTHRYRRRRASQRNMSSSEEERSSDNPRESLTLSDGASEPDLAAILSFLLRR